MRSVHHVPLPGARRQIEKKKGKGGQGPGKGRVVMGRDHVPSGQIVIAVGDVGRFIDGEGISRDAWQDLEREQEDEQAIKVWSGGSRDGFHFGILTKKGRGTLIGIAPSFPGRY
jgi:hypothetical protein